MSIKTKEESVLELFFNEPTKHWHFKDIVNTVKISEQRANFWLKKFLSEDLIKRIKPKGKMPYYISNFESIKYKNKKKVFAFNKMQITGLLDRLASLENAKTVVLFGSYVREDWNTRSDIDVFVFGDPEELKFGKFWKGLGFQGKSREVEVHTFSSKDEIKEVRSGLMNNIARGYFVKGSIHDILEVSV